jgi:3-deoxy-D-manno-octulosonic-acid transferase
MTIYTLVTAILLFPAALLLLFILPFKELKERFGLKKNTEKGAVWFHCASVGEVNALRPLLSEFKKHFPDQRLMLTTMTVTGKKRAEELPELDMISLIPLDFLPFISGFIKKTDPKIIVIIETELWPALFYAARNKRIPLCLINGRISDKTYQRYRLLSFMIKELFRSVVFTGAQSESDKQRFLKLGFKNVHNTHNLKFCLHLEDYDPQSIRKEWNLKKSDFVLVWGSSRPGEEELLLSMLPELEKNIPHLKVIIAPRHLKRLEQVTTIFKDHPYALLTGLTKKYNILIIDSMNILAKAYAAADIAVVGGSFSDFGGHNPLEPAFYAKPIVIGSYHSSCRQSVKALRNNDAILVSTKESLAADILQLYHNEKKRDSLGSNAKKTLVDNARSVEENVRELMNILASSEKEEQRF